MRSPDLARLAGLSVAALIVLSSVQAAHADTFVGGTNVWSMIGVPVFTSTGTPVAVVEFSNGLDQNVSGIVVMALRNGPGQMVYYTTGTVTISPLQIGQAALVEFGVPAGTYNATFFAMTFSGLPISSLSSATLVVP